MDEQRIITESTEPLWRMDYQLTEQEIAQGLRLTDMRRAGPVKIAVESVILGAAGLYFLIGYLTGDRTRTDLLLLTVCCVFVLGMLLLAPKLQAESLARREAKRQKTVTVRGYNGALGFGTGDVFNSVDFSEFQTVMHPEMIVLRFSGGQLLMLPRRAATEEIWQWLTEHLPTSEPTGKARK